MNEYYSYLSSVDWVVRTLSVRLRNNGICECCNMRYGAEVHHRTYVNLFKEKDEELVHLCDVCHKHIHQIRDGYVWPSRLRLLETLRREADLITEKS